MKSRLAFLRPGFRDPRINLGTVASGPGDWRTVLGAYGDPLLPRRDVDVPFFRDVIHPIEDRQAYLRSTAFYMARAVAGRTSIPYS